MMNRGSQKHFQLQWLRHIVAFWFSSDPSPCDWISHWCLGDLIDEILATKSCWCWCWGQLWQKLGNSCTAFPSLATDWKCLVTVYTHMAVYSFFKQSFWRMHSTLGSFVPLAMFEFSRQGTVLQQTSHLYDLIRTDIMMEPMYSMLCLK